MPDQADASPPTSTLLTLPAPPPASPPAPESGTQAVLRDAFMLGWEIVELKSRVQIALVEPVHAGLRLASVWRASLNRIAALQSKAFPSSATAHTLYEPPSEESLPYLYPPEPDYANVGISGTDSRGATILGNFKLYEVTRRAINCLTLLYIREDESLIPVMIRRNQDHLTTEILKAAQDPGSGGGEEQPNGGEPPRTPLEVAKSVLTERTVKFLEAWEGYLRENYYAGGVIPNDNMELIAFEAGQSMSSLSWGVSVATVPLEQAARAEDAAGVLPANVQAFVEAWGTVFRSQAVIRLQHQISALSSELDDAYYAQHPDKRRPDDDAVLAVPNPDLPSQAIRAVKQSIDYWQRAVLWIPAHLDEIRQPAPGMLSWNTRLRLALTEQANVWQTLMTGQQSLRAYNMESVTHEIMKDVTAEIQKNVRLDFKQGVQQGQQLMQEVAAEVKEVIETTGRIATDGLNELLRHCLRAFWPILAVGALIFLGLLIVAVLSPSSGAIAASGGAGLTAAVSAVLGYFGWGNLKGVKAAQQRTIESDQAALKSRLESKANTPAPAGAPEGDGGLLSRVGGAAQETGAMVLKAFERGYRQIRIELDGLNRSVAVTYPLVEFFGLAFRLKSDMAFLTDIIWSGTEREAELKRVMRAAFGPLALFISPAADGGGPEAQAPAVQASHPPAPPAV